MTEQRRIAAIMHFPKRNNRQLRERRAATLEPTFAVTHPQLTFQPS